jgi:hypothetical protein
MYHTFRICQALAAGLLLALGALPAPARAQDLSALEEGMRIYQGLNSCELCHLFSGTGFQHNMLFGPVPAGGPSLVKSTLTRDEMIEMVRCGRLTPISIMPRYDGDAWTKNGPCWGKVAADIPAEELPVHGERLLARRQIELVVDYVRAAYQGHGMSHEWCVRYFPTSPKACDTLIEGTAATPAAPTAPGTVVRPGAPAPFVLPAVAR